MIRSGFDPGIRQDGGAIYRTAGIAQPNLTQVLVAGRSQITRVVVSRIVERCGLRPQSEAPETAVQFLKVNYPGTIILDGGANNRECDALIAGIVALRRSSGRPVPLVILLSTRMGTPESLGLDSAVDAVVAKPITPECLQPVVDRLLERARG